MEMTDHVFKGHLDKYPRGILINGNNKGYCRIGFDDASL